MALLNLAAGAQCGGRRLDPVPVHPFAGVEVDHDQAGLFQIGGARAPEMDCRHCRLHKAKKAVQIVYAYKGRL